MLSSRKREIRLLKNREAARECRRKKKEYIKCLENRSTIDIDVVLVLLVVDAIFVVVVVHDLFFIFFFVSKYVVGASGGIGKR